VIDIAARCDIPDTDLPALLDAVRATCADRGVTSASVGLMVVGADDMATINGEHRGKPEPTDVLSFPVDGPDVLHGGWPSDGPAPELGDVIICPAAALEPLTTLAVHGVLHLLGYDHEVDDGEMLALQDAIVERL
jgi:probable rRNA maturation factor